MKKHIVVFAHLFKPHLGGLEKYVKHFYKRIPDCKITVITSKYEKELKSKEQDENLNIVRIDTIQMLKDKYYIPSLSGFNEIKKILTSSKDIEIHTHTRFYLTNFLATILAKKYRITHFHFEHGSSFVQDGSVLVRLFAYIFDQTLGKYILKKSDSVFPISEGVRKFLENNYKNIKFGPTLYNSYDFKDKEYKNTPKPTKPKLLFVGRLVIAKGVYELLEAAKILKKENFPFTLTLIGDGSERGNIEKYVWENKLGKHILVRGKLPYEETQLEFPKHDLFINPSYTEGLPTTVLEALFNNLLIIATDVGGTKEILPQKMLINREELSAEKIVEDIKDTLNKWGELKKEYEKIFNEDKEKFSWDKNVKKFLEYSK